MAITIDARGTSGGLNYDTYIADFFSAVVAPGGTGDYTFLGGTADTFYGSTYYMNGDQVVFENGDGSGGTSDQVVLLGGEEFAYDYIHHGSSYGHGMSGLLESLSFGTADSIPTSASGELLTSFAAALQISGIDLDTEPGTGPDVTTNQLMALWYAIASGDSEAIYEFLAEQAQIFIGSEGNDTYTGTEFADTIGGNDGADVLAGGAGNDAIDGGAGSDRMTGGAGSDTFVVDDAGDRVVEAADEGTDSVSASVSFSLSANVENLTLTGSAAIDGSGNGLANTITGNGADNRLLGGAGDDILKAGAGADWLDGGTGNDRMAGGTGDDTYVVDSTGDQVVEDAGAGTDTVLSSLTTTLGANVENLTLLAGSGPVDGTGNGLANTITGNNGTNTLSGLGGKDTLLGGKGADTLLGGNGIDVLKGGAGHDVLVGGAARDVLYGGGGKDTFLFTSLGDSFQGKGATRDLIADFQKGKDVIDLSGLDADSTTKGVQDFTFIGASRFSGEAGELAVKITESGRTLVRADIDGDGKVDFAILLDKKVGLGVDDFLI